MIYVICFGLSALFAWFASKTKKRTFFVFFSVISILLPVTLAGLRDYSIGIDTSNYLELAQFWWGAAERDTLQAYLEYYNSKEFGEPLFALILGLVEHYTGNFTVFLFVEHAVIMTGIYIGAFRQRKHANPVLVLLLFYLCFYNHSLNITRQYMAMAIIFAAFADIEQRKYLRFILVVLVARFIHASAPLVLGALLIHWLLFVRYDRVIPSMKPSLGNRRAVIVGVMVIVVFVFPWLCQVLINAKILPIKYQFYLNTEEAQHTTLITLFLLVEMAVLFVFRKNMRSSTPYYNFYLVSSIVYLFLHQLSANIVYGKRIAAYYSLTNLVTIALIPRGFKKRENRIIATILVVLVALVYWWYSYVVNNGSETYPYVFVSF